MSISNNQYALVALLALTLPLTAGARGFDDSTSTSRTDIEEQRQADFDAADTDGDGYLSLAELEALHESILAEEFSSVDSDSSGDIDVDELFEANPRLDEAQTQALLDLADTSGDGTLNDEEFAVLRGGNAQGRLWEQFVMLDADSDGRISNEEFLAEHGHGHH